ncbi:MAG: large conductance mechanosensitive channel protein MscL [Candidatus Promineifilaceae bacterium]|jgi:large conductance mechanosensitive channel
MSWVSDFRKFVMRGNVVDMAVGVAIGTAFTAIVNSLVGDIITPFVSGMMGGTDFTQLSFQFGDATIAYGNFIQAIVNFIFIALVIFFVIRWAIRISETAGMDASELEGIVPDSERDEEEPEPEPEPSEEVVLLTEIRDLMRAQAGQ